MTTLRVDTSEFRSSILAGDHRADGVEWTSRLVRAATTAVGLDSTVAMSRPTTRDVWPVELSVAGQPAILIDVDLDTVGDDWLDLLELRAISLWRAADPGKAGLGPRPWVGALCICDELDPKQAAVERLARLVASRHLDSAGVVVIDRADERLWSPRPGMSLEAFQAALLGRCLYLRAVSC